uniref:Uncharacterized protein n=2 Tax=Parascaris univalens TaxID=6257 RepID=A0A915AC36_PARUN
MLQKRFMVIREGTSVRRTGLAVDTDSDRWRNSMDIEIRFSRWSTKQRAFDEISGKVTHLSGIAPRGREQTLSLTDCSQGGALSKGLFPRRENTLPKGLFPRGRTPSIRDCSQGERTLSLTDCSQGGILSLRDCSQGERNSSRIS